MILSRSPLIDQERSNDDAFLDEATHKKIRRHISDKNDVISEEDIRNVRTDFTEPGPKVAGTEEQEALGLNETVVNSENENEPPEDSIPIITPWSVISS